MLRLFLTGCVSSCQVICFSFIIQGHPAQDSLSDSITLRESNQQQQTQNDSTKAQKKVRKKSNSENLLGSEMLKHARQHQRIRAAQIQKTVENTYLEANWNKADSKNRIMLVGQKLIVKTSVSLHRKIEWLLDRL